MQRSFNPVLMLVIGLPSIVVLASFASLALALLRPDGELPEQYHWQGLKLDRDFSEAQHAADLNISATFSRDERAAVCRLSLRIQAEKPATLRVILTHATQPALDRRFTFSRTPSGIYEAPCDPIPNSHWRMELQDRGNWSMRQTLAGSLSGWTINAKADADP
jgi:hypothetical protein